MRGHENHFAFVTSDKIVHTYNDNNITWDKITVAKDKCVNLLAN